MSAIEEVPDATDGRVARREQNIDEVLDVVVQMFSEDAMFPSIEQVAERSGKSLRSMYRYFADPGELLEAAIRRTAVTGRRQARLPSIGRGPLDQRIDDLVKSRLRIFEQSGAVARGAVVNAPRHSRIREQLASDRNDLRNQFELQFAPELSKMKGADRESRLSAGDLLTQIESIDFLRRHRQLTVAETEETLSSTLRSLLT